jgi:hypothetical protein
MSHCGLAGGCSKTRGTSPNIACAVLFAMLLEGGKHNVAVLFRCSRASIDASTRHHHKADDASPPFEPQAPLKRDGNYLEHRTSIY